MSKLQERMRRLDLKDGDIVLCPPGVVRQIWNLPPEVRAQYPKVFLLTCEPEDVRSMTDEQLADMGLYRKPKVEIVHG